MNQGSAALVSQFFLGNSSGALGKRTERPRISISIPPTPSARLWAARLTDLCPQQRMTFRLFFKYGISLPHSRLLTRCSVTHPKYSPPSVKTCFFHTWNNTTIPQRNHKVKNHVVFFCWISLCWYYWTSWNLMRDRWICLVRIPSPNTNPPPPLHPNKCNIAGCLAVFPRPCLETRDGPRHHTDGKQRTLHKQLPAPLASCTLWALEHVAPRCSCTFCTSRCTLTQLASRNSRNRKLKECRSNHSQTTKKLNHLIWALV